jgi:hypothetical protein
MMEFFRKKKSGPHNFFEGSFKKSEFIFLDTDRTTEMISFLFGEL